MPGFEAIFPQLAGLDSSERERLLTVLTTEANASPTALDYRVEFPSIVTTPDVCGGVARIIRTRIPIWTLERMRQLGISESDILRSYPTLCATDLVQAWAYVAKHHDEVDQAILANEED